MVENKEIERNFTYFLSYLTTPPQQDSKNYHTASCNYPVELENKKKKFYFFYRI